jgi:cytochrome-b5 reductase
MEQISYYIKKLELWKFLLKILPEQLTQDEDLTLYILFTIFCIIISTVFFFSALFFGKSKKRKALDSEVWKSFPLIEIEQISHDVKRFRFQLPTPEHIVGLPIGQHISLKFVDKDGQECQRSYTPTTSDDEAGYVDFVIKIYPICLPEFPNGIYEINLFKYIILN